MTRFARERRVFFVEEPLFDAAAPRLDLEITEGVHVVVPHLPPGDASDGGFATQRQLIRELLKEQGSRAPIVWLYTPLALPLVDNEAESIIIYDCMDELSAFMGASPVLVQRERDLLQRAHLVFTGGESLYEAKRARHPRVFLFPSSVDVAHFSAARQPQPEPTDQRSIPHPRLGFCGVIDERMDLELVASVAKRHADWHFVMVGPVVKIDPASLPTGANLHYLGLKAYAELPAYLAGWDVALLPFARNEATRFISPTKTPEYLAAALPVVSTAVPDVVRPYGERRLVHIASSPSEFAAAIATALNGERDSWLRDVDQLLATMSWDRTWSAMNRLIDQAIGQHRATAQADRVSRPLSTRAVAAEYGLS
ncbi:MAG: glycosyltransferase [Acidobacteria bacterium]|nr:glycosyltransferase [Acidobacteriota bacterium]